MGRNFRAKNIFDVLLAVFFVSWIFFQIVIWGNSVDIFWYEGLSGKLCIFFGELSPIFSVYMFMVIWKDVSDRDDYIKKIISCSQPLRATIITAIYTSIFVLLSVYSGVRNDRSLKFLFFAIPLSLVCFGLAEVAWRGYIFKAMWERFSFVSVTVVIGVLQALYYIPLYGVKGTRYQQMTELPYLLFYNVFLSIMLCCLYRMTSSILSCVLFETIAHSMLYIFDDLMMVSPRVVAVCIFEITFAYIFAYKLGVNVPGKGWALPEEEDYT